MERHGKIMDQYDPDKKIGMIVDEWGCWFTVEPGTNPGFFISAEHGKGCVGCRDHPEYL